jgi:PAS domain S-box-containing protein
LDADPAAPTRRDDALAAENERLRRQLASVEQAARADESRQRMILDSAVDYAVIVLDLDGLVTRWNGGARRILGWTEAEMLGEPVSMFFTLADLEACIPQAEMRAALQYGRGNDERWHLRKDGSCFWASGEMMPLRDEGGATQGFIKVLRDRTEQRRADEAQRADAEFLRSVLASSADCIKVLDLDAKLVFMSEGGQRVMEVGDFNAIRGCPWPDFWQGELRTEAQSAVLAAMAGGIGRFRGIADTMAGTPRFWDVQVTPIFGADGRPDKLLSVSRDVTATRDAEAALQKSEAYWRGLFECLQEGLIVGELVRGADGRVADWRYLDVNPAWGRQVGIPPEAAAGRTVRELFPGIEDAWVDEMAAVVETGRAAAFTRQVGGIGRWYEGSAFALEGDRFAVLFQEVTERKRAEVRRAALLELDDWSRDLEDPAELSSVAAEVIGRTLGINRAGYATMDDNGETAVVARDWTAPGVPSIAGPHRMQDYGSFIENLRRGETVVVADTAEDARTSGAHAALRTVTVRALVNVPIVEQGRLVAFLFVNCTEPRAWSAEEIGFIRGVAGRARSAIERRRAEQGLRDLAASLERQVAERTAEYDRVWQNSRDLLVVVGADGVFRAVNPAWTGILGHAPDGVVGRSFLEFIWPDDAGPTQDALDAAAAARDLTRFENRFRHEDGTPRWISWSTSLEGGLVYAYGRDVTAEREQAEALRQAEERLLQSQKMEAVGQLTGGLAHDFNNLLTGITGSLELLQARIAQGRTNDVDRYVNAAQGAAKRAAALTHRLLAFSRRQTLDPKATDVNRLAKGMEELVQRTVGPGITVETITAGGLWATLVDPGQLENALLNLCINGRDAMPGGGKLTVETGNKWLDARAARERDLPAGQYVTLCVSDTGTGMTPEVAARAFDPFFTTKPIGMGTGLGLSMIYGFVRQSGGQARIYSEIGRGTMVCLYLPRHLGEARDAEREPELSDAPRAERGETVLVVDDEPTVRMLVADVLEDLGYTAIEASDGASGLKVLRSDVRIDLLVTDVGLPGGMNGRQVADAARELRPGLKVLFITGYAENAVLSHGHLDPGMHVLTKPFAMEMLASRIKDLIDGK